MFSADGSLRSRNRRVWILPTATIGNSDRHYVVANTFVTWKVELSII